MHSAARLAPAGLTFGKSSVLTPAVAAHSGHVSVAGSSPLLSALLCSENQQRHSINCLHQYVQDLGACNWGAYSRQRCLFRPKQLNECQRCHGLCQVIVHSCARCQNFDYRNVRAPLAAVRVRSSQVVGCPIHNEDSPQKKHPL